MGRLFHEISGQGRLSEVVIIKPRPEKRTGASLLPGRNVPSRESNLNKCPQAIEFKHVYSQTLKIKLLLFGSQG